MEKDKKQIIEEIVDAFMKSFIYLETGIDDFITYYIIEYDISKDGDRREMFHECFLKNLSFIRKQETLIKVIKKSFPQFATLISNKNLNTIRELRNRIAHSFIDVKIDDADFQGSLLVFEKSLFSKNLYKDYTYRAVSDAAKLCLKIVKTLLSELKRMRESNASHEAHFQNHCRSKKI